MCGTRQRNPDKLLRKSYNYNNFYPRGASSARVIAIIVCLCLCVCVCVCVFVCVCVCVTRRHCIKTAKHRIMETTPRDSQGTLVY